MVTSIFQDGSKRNEIMVIDGRVVCFDDGRLVLEYIVDCVETSYFDAEMKSEFVRAFNNRGVSTFYSTGGRDYKMVANVKLTVYMMIFSQMRFSADVMEHDIETRRLTIGDFSIVCSNLYPNIECQTRAVSDVHTARSERSRQNKKTKRGGKKRRQQVRERSRTPPMTQPRNYAVPPGFIERQQLPPGYVRAPIPPPLPVSYEEHFTANRVERSTQMTFEEMRREIAELKAMIGDRRRPRDEEDD